LDNVLVKLTPEEAAQRREAQASAAEARSKDFKQGGGGEKLKAKQRALENAEKKNSALGGGNAMDARQFD